MPCLVRLICFYPDIETKIVDYVVKDIVFFWRVSLMILVLSFKLKTAGKSRLLVVLSVPLS